jgi:LPXTG-site transpeptidase (sortase) family protein
MRQTVRFFSSVATVYILTIGVIGYALYPAPIFGSFSSPAYAKSPAVEKVVQQATQPKHSTISGKPIRVTVPDYGIDLPVDEGHYNEADSSWTLSNDHANYAMMTTLANNTSGNTLIYGHGTDAIFGKLGAKTPPTGTVAEIYTDNNHVFTYTFTDVRNLTPNDVYVLSEQSAKPTLTLQTCTGVFSEWRTMFRFEFKEMIQ